MLLLVKQDVGNLRLIRKRCRQQNHVTEQTVGQRRFQPVQHPHPKPVGNLYILRQRHGKAESAEAAQMGNKKGTAKKQNTAQPDQAENLPGGEGSSGCRGFRNGRDRQNRHSGLRGLNGLCSGSDCCRLLTGKDGQIKHAQLRRDKDGDQQPENGKGPQGKQYAAVETVLQ